MFDQDQQIHRIEDRSVRNLVERHIMEEIRQERLRPGDRLVEATIGEALGVSLTPVREALFHLGQGGIIVHRPRRGFYVAEFGAEHLAEIATLRAALEGLAAAEAARHITPQDAAELERLIADGVRALRAGDPLRNAELNAAFHLRIIRAARHSLLERAWGLTTPLRWLMMPVAAPGQSEAWIVDWEQRHRTLLGAIQSGDPMQAEQAARHHVMASAEGPRSRQQRDHRGAGTSSATA